MDEKPILCVMCKKPTGMRSDESVLKNVVVYCAVCNAVVQEKRRQTLVRNRVPALLWDRELSGG